MAGKPIGGGGGGGEGLSVDFAGMTKNQLYDIMCQMKTLIEQNKQQAREILIQNPLLTKALFQAQIMLGMVQPPQVIPNIQPASSQQPQQPVQASQQSNIPAAHKIGGGSQDQTGISQPQHAIRKQYPTQPSVPVSSATGSLSATTPQSDPVPPHLLQIPQQAKGPSHPQLPTVAVPQSSQVPNLPPPIHPTSQMTPLHQPLMPGVSGQLQRPLQTTAVSHLPPQQPMPLQPRPSSMPGCHHQYASPVVPGVGFSHPGAPQHSSQPMFHGQQPLPNQLSLESHYRAGGAHMGVDSHPPGSMMQAERAAPWMSGPPDSSTMMHLSGPPALSSGPTGQSIQSSQPASLTPQMEQALLQQVMSLTTEQINQLPLEQRHQVLQLQQMLRQRN